MVELTALWLPILLSSVLVFVASSIIHMVLPWHKSDYPAVPNQDKVMDALRPFAIPPGDYMIPRCKDRADANSPEFKAKLEKGPVMVVTVLPSGQWQMGKQLSQWFVYLVVVSAIAAYVTGRALPAGANYLQVFRFVGTTTFIAHSAAAWPVSIWYRRAWSITLKNSLDGLIYGLLAAGVFGWLWPR